MINLQLDLYAVRKHAQIVMRELGITYQKSVPQSIADCWQFFNCKNVPEVLPEYLTVINLPIEKFIGYGLSAEDVESLNASEDKL